MSADPRTALPEDLRASWESMTPEERDTLVHERALYRALSEKLQGDVDDLRATLASIRELAGGPS